MYKVGDIVYVPNAYDVIWEPYATIIEDVLDPGHIVCFLKHKNYSSFNGQDITQETVLNIKQVFSNSIECQKYIQNYYYDGLCRNCNYYKDSGTILRCLTCTHNCRHKTDSSTHNWEIGVCSYSGLQVWTQEKPNLGEEICKHYSPTITQYTKWTWDKYNDLLQKCEFNQDCIHHSCSCHKTISYDKYINEFKRIPFSSIYDKKNIDYVYIKRKEWVDQDFYDDKGIWCWGVVYSPEFTKTGKIKKGSCNIAMMFRDKTYIKR